MLKFLLERIITSILTLLLLSIVVFSMIHLAPGDPARIMLPQEATDEDVEVLREALGMNKSLHVQYLVWLKNAVKLDFGKSLGARYSASKVFLSRLPATLEITFGGLFIAILFAIPIGIFVAIRRNSLWDFNFSLCSIAFLSTPRFWLGILLILLFSSYLGWLPPFGRGPGFFTAVCQLFKGDYDPLWQCIRHLILPSVNLAAWFFAVFLRHTRTNVIEELGKLYIKTAREKGITEIKVMLAHTIRNALIPIVTIIGLYGGRVMGGAVVTEIVFAWPGVGQLLVRALFARDYPLVQACLFMVGMVIIAIFILMDLMYVLIDPRARINR